MYNSFNILVSAYLHYSIGEATSRSIAVDNNPIVSTCDDFLHCPLTNDITVTAMVREENERACLVHAVEGCRRLQDYHTRITAHHTVIYTPHNTTRDNAHRTHKPIYLAACDNGFPETHRFDGCDAERFRRASRTKEEGER
jgi:hypothetical protein